jgi:hypothetical protein
MYQVNNQLLLSDLDRLICKSRRIGSLRGALLTSLSHVLVIMLLNFPRCLSILLLQTSKTDNNGLDIDAVYNLKLRQT